MREQMRTQLVDVTYAQRAHAVECLALEISRARKTPGAPPARRPWSGASRAH